MGLFPGWLTGLQHLAVFGSVILSPVLGSGLAVATAGAILVEWAMASASPRISRDRISRERKAQKFEVNAKHVVVCGPSGSGKSSLLNAFMGKRNGKPGTAATGTTETTETHAKYQGHPNLNSVVLHAVTAPERAPSAYPQRTTTTTRNSTCSTRC